MDTLKLRHILGSFVTGVTIVTTMDEAGVPKGFTANSFTSVSLDPPLILVCVGRTSSSYDTFRGCGHFVVNVLAEKQRDLSAHFARKGADKFAGAKWQLTRNGSPVFENVLGWLDCRVHQKLEVGDHLILIGQVEDLGGCNDIPLGYFRGQYVSLGTAEEMKASSRQRAVLGCLATYGEQILLSRKKGSRQWGLPLTSDTMAGARGRAALLSQFEAFGAPLDLNFLYSVWEWEEHQAVYLFYRGVLRQAPSEGRDQAIEARLFHAHEIPWDDIDADLFHGMLRRFLREREAERFGIFAELGDTSSIGVLSADMELLRSRYL